MMKYRIIYDVDFGGNPRAVAKRVHDNWPEAVAIGDTFTEARARLIEKLKTSPSIPNPEEIEI